MRAKARSHKVSTTGTNNKKTSSAKTLSLPDAQWFIRLSFLFVTLSLLTAILLVFRESGFYMFAIDGVATSIFVIVLTLIGEFVDRRLMHFSMLLYVQMLRTGLIEASFKESLE